MNAKTDDHRGSKALLLLDSLEALLPTDKITPRGVVAKPRQGTPNYQIHIHQCRRKGCSHTRYLDLHHLIPRTDGGTNEAENLVTLCSACHRLLHENSVRSGILLTTVKVVWERGFTRSAGQDCAPDPDEPGNAASR